MTTDLAYFNTAYLVSNGQDIGTIPNNSLRNGFPYGFGLASDASPAPEPSQVGVLALIGLGLGGLMLRARRRVNGAFGDAA